MLLKNNDNLLPLAKTGGSLVVIGDNNTVVGGGSGSVVTPYIVTPVDGIMAAVGNGWSVSYNDGKDADKAAALAAQADVAIVVVATESTEGIDRQTLSLGEAQDQLVSAVAAKQAKTVVVVRSPGAALMPWVDEVPSILEQWMSGQEGGNSLADVLFGDVNPSGRLPLSFPKSDNDTWLQSVQQYPGVTGSEGWLEVEYTEELLMGYRWYDAKGVKPLFPFGHGLSYTTFQYGDLKVQGSVSSTSNATITFTITNTGTRAGREVPQLYLSFPPSTKEPRNCCAGFPRSPFSQRKWPL